ncbi:MAG TPA: hypothetical protein ENO30_01625 [Thermodesulfobium narugense]|nr:hypothetical protein [Thermodesulfobium narugense]
MTNSDWHLKDPLAKLICDLFGCEKIRCVMNEEQEKRVREIFVRKFKIYMKNHKYISVNGFFLSHKEIMPFVQKANVYKIGKVYSLLKKKLIKGEC